MRSRLHAPQSPLHKRTSDKNFSGLRHVSKIHATATSRVPLLHIDCSVISLAFTYRSGGEKQQRYLNWSGKTRALNRRRDKMDRDYYATEHFWAATDPVLVPNSPDAKRFVTHVTVLHITLPAT